MVYTLKQLAEYEKNRNAHSELLDEKRANSNLIRDLNAEIKSLIVVNEYLYGKGKAESANKIAQKIRELKRRRKYAHHASTYLKNYLKVIQICMSSWYL